MLTIGHRLSKPTVALSPKFVFIGHPLSKPTVALSPKSVFMGQQQQEMQVDVELSPPAATVDLLEVLQRNPNETKAKVRPPFVTLRYRLDRQEFRRKAGSTGKINKK